MTLYTWIILACWATFLSVWGVSALTAKRTVNNPYWQSRFIWIRLVGVLVILGLFYVWDRSGGVRPISLHTPFSPALSALGALLAVLGVSLAVWARTHLGRNWGMPLAEKEHAELVATGPYAYVRHPIYTGVILMLLGDGLVVGALYLALALFFLFYFSYAAKREEKLMLEKFPDAYRAYMARTKMFIPGVF